MNKREPYVWIVNEAGHDYTSAESFGELRRLTLGDINPLQLDRLSYHLSRGIAKHTSVKDYLLVSGTPVVNSVAFHLWLTMHKTCRLLQWNAKKRDYELTEVTHAHLVKLLDNEMMR